MRQAILIHHRGTESTEVTRRKPGNSLCFLCVLRGSAVGFWFLGFCFLAASAALSAATFPARLEKPLWPDREGTLDIDAEGITFTAPVVKRGAEWMGLQHVGHELDKLHNRPHRLAWKWLDIQYFDRISRKEFVVLTYKDDWRFLGRDEQFRFRITRGELSDALFREISRHLERPVTDRVPPGAVRSRYTIPVKREGTFRGSEGELEFVGDDIYFVTKREAGGRTWRLDRDVASVSSDDPYRLEIRVYENNRREFSRTATYKFDLKQKLDPEFYRELELRVYKLEGEGGVIR